MKKKFLVLFMAFFSIGIGVCMADDKYMASVHSGAEFLKAGQKNAIFGVFHCYRVVDGIVEGCGDKVEIISLPIKFLGQFNITNLKFTQETLAHGKREVVATAKVADDGSIVDIKQVRPWSNKMLIIEGDVSPNIVTGFQGLELTGLPIIKNNGQLLGLAIDTKNPVKYKNAIVNHEVKFEKIEKEPKSFSYRVIVDIPDPIETKISIRTLSKKGDMSIGQIKCYLNNTKITNDRVDIFGRQSNYLATIKIKNGDIINFTINEKVFIDNLDINIGIHFVSESFGVPKTEKGEIVLVNYWDRWSI